jgi:hypothetical protein
LRWLRPIPEEWIPSHLLLFIALFVVGMVLRAVEQVPAHERGDVVGFTNAMIDGSVSVIVVSAAVSTAIVEGALIFAEKYLKHRFERGREEGRDEGRKEGRDEGREEGAELERERWIEWMARKQAAEDAGEVFDEPSPAECSASFRRTVQ